MARLNAREIPRKQLEQSFRRFCCSSICPNVLSQMSIKEMKKLTAFGIYNARVKFDSLEPDENKRKRNAMLSAARDTGLSQATVEKWFYESKPTVNI